MNYLCENQEWDMILVVNHDNQVPRSSIIHQKIKDCSNAKTLTCIMHLDEFCSDQMLTQTDQEGRMETHY